MKKHFLLFMLAVALLAGCAKSTTETNEVMVRIDNRLSVSMDATKVGNTDFGNIAPGNKTSYRPVAEPIYSGFCSFDSVAEKRYAGYFLFCGTPPLPPSLTPGYYTFLVEENGFFSKKLTVIKN